MIAEFACQGLKQKQQWRHSEALLCTSFILICGDHTLQMEFGSFWLDTNDLLKEITRMTEYVQCRKPVRRLAIMTRKVRERKSHLGWLCCLPEPLGEGGVWYSSYYVHKHKPIFRTDSQRISKPSYTVVVCTHGYLGFVFSTLLGSHALYVPLHVLLFLKPKHNWY